MPRRHDDLYARIAAFGALREAALAAVRGKRRKPGAAAFMANLEHELLRLERELLDGSYRPGGYSTFEVREPNRRFISAAPFRDRVVHHALCAVVAPLFERGFIDGSFANREGKGTHRAIARFERFRDRYRCVLRCDIHRYFPAIDHAVLKADLRRRVRCTQTLALLDAIVDGSNPQEPVDAYFPGDDLFAPYARRRGLPLGNLTSQLWANFFLDPLDHWITETKHFGAYARYTDDFLIFADDKAVLHELRAGIEEHLAELRLELAAEKTRLMTTGAGVPFCGFIFRPGLRPRVLGTTKRRFEQRRARLACGRDFLRLTQAVVSWYAFSREGNSAGLRRAYASERNLTALRILQTQSGIIH